MVMGKPSASTLGSMKLATETKSNGIVNNTDDKCVVNTDVVNINMNIVSSPETPQSRQSNPSNSQSDSPSQKNSLNNDDPPPDEGVMEVGEGSATTETLPPKSKAQIQGNLQTLLQQHGADGLPPIGAVSASTSSLTGVRSRSNTILSEFGFASGIRSRSNTMGSDLDLDFVHYACDTWGLIVSNAQQLQLNQLQAATSAQYQQSQIMFPGKDLGNMNSGNASSSITTTTPQSSLGQATATSVATIPKSRPSAPFSCAASSTTVQLKHPGSMYISNSGGRGSCSPALSSSYEDSVSGFLSGHTGLLNHTPPFKGTSYEASHFGKRMRSGVSHICLGVLFSIVCEAKNKLSVASLFLVHDMHNLALLLHLIIFNGCVE